MNSRKIEFLYLNEEDMIRAGVLDGKRCNDTIERVLSLLEQGDFRMGGDDGNSHGIMMAFPETSDIPDYPLDAPDRRFMAMPAYLGGEFHIAGEKFYGSNKKNHDLGLPRSILMVTLSDVETGAPLAYMSANLLSSMRTGAVPGVFCRYFARKDARSVGLIGTGAVNTMFLNCLIPECPDIDTVKLKATRPTSRSLLALKAYIEEHFPQITKIIACETLEECVRDTDVISEAVSCPEDQTPYIEEAWIEPGATFLSSEHLRFSEEFQMNRAVKVIDNWQLYDGYHDLFAGNKGPGHPWLDLGGLWIDKVKRGEMKFEDAVEIGAVINGKRPGRQNEDDVVICKAGGMPILDVGWGCACYRRAQELGLGTMLKLWDEPYLS